MSKKANIFGKKVPMFVIALIAVIGLVSAAGYIVNTLTLTVGVAEPFTVEYAVLGDSGTYTVAGDGTCADNDDWFTKEQVEFYPIGDMIIGESRKLCVKITNEAEAAIPYVISVIVTDKDGNVNTNPDALACNAAFGQASIPGTALAGTSTGPTDTINGALVQPASNVAPVSNCKVAISVARG